MSGVWEGLAPTTWYKAVMAVSGPALLITLASQRDALTLIFAGTFLVGLGEWKNHRRFIEFGHVAGRLAKRTDAERNTTWLGVSFQILGGILIIYGACRVLGVRIPFIDV